MTAVQRVVSLITEMDASERAQVISAVRALEGNVVRLRAAVLQISPSRDWLLSGIEAELQRRGQAFPTLTMAKVKDLAPSYHEEASLVMGDLEARMRRAYKGEVQHIQMIALGHVVARALARKLEAYRPVSVKSLLTSVALVPEAIEESFPGYLQCGMISMLIHQR